MSASNAYWDADLYTHMGLGERFWSKYREDTETGCWVWEAAINQHGYGVYMTSDGTELAHRLAYADPDDPPADQYVLHHCDNPACVNPDHLYAGDQRDNIRDALNRGRIPVGEDAPNAKLTRDQVQKIHDLLNNGVAMRDIADRFGVTSGTVSDIARGKSWSHVDIDNPYYEGREFEPYRDKLSEEDVAEIKRLLDDGIIQARIADYFDIDDSVISRINTGESYPGVEPNSANDGWVELERCGYVGNKLTEDDVREIKQKLASGEYYHHEIAEEYDVSRSMISQINNGKRWEGVS